MEGLIILIFIGMVLSSLKKDKKAQQQKRANERQKQTMQQYARQSRPQAAAPKPAVTRPAAPGPAAQPVMMLDELEPAEAYRPAKSTAIAPTVQVTKHTDDIFEGSMAMASTEGYDPCHDDELHEAVNPCELAPDEDEAPVAVTGGLGLEWTGNAMVKAMVMQEVLTRPCDRMRR